MADVKNRGTQKKTAKSKAGFKFKNPKILFRKPLLVGLVSGLVLLLAAGSYLCWKFFVAEPADSAVAGFPDQLSSDGKGAEVPAESRQTVGLDELFSMAPFHDVPLKDSDRSVFLHVSIELEVAPPAIKPELEEKSVILREIVLSVIKEKTSDEIRSIKGKILLKNELILIMNRILENGRIRTLYFTEFFITG